MSNGVAEIFVIVDLLAVRLHTVRNGRIVSQVERGVFRERAMQRSRLFGMFAACLATATPGWALDATQWMGKQATQNAAVNIARVADVIFPKTRDWTRYESLPEASPSDLIDAERLRDAPPYPKPSTADAGKGILADVPGCSAALRLFVGRDAHRKFRKIRLYQNGSEALLYSGNDPCSESSISLVWRNIDNPAIDLYSLDAEIIRIDPADASQDGPKFLAFYHESGGSLVDTYFVTSSLSRHREAVETCEGLVIPEGAKSEERLLTFQADHILQPMPASMPAEKLEPDGLSFPGKALKGTRAKQLLTYTDAAGLTWRFVVAPSKTSDGSDGSLAGWVHLTTP